MPSFTHYDVEVDVDVDVDVDEFLEECDDKEINQVIEWLTGNDYLENLKPTTDKTSIGEQEFIEALYKLSKHKMSLTVEEENIILNIAKRF